MIEKSKIKKWTKLAYSMLIIIMATNSQAQLVKDSVPELSGVDVVERLGEYVPTDLKFTDDKGRAVTIGDYLGNDKPTILVLGYYECPMLCNLVSNGLMSAMRQLKWQPGDEYQIVNVSINHREDFELAAGKKKNYLSALDIPSADSGWHFLVGEEANSKALADAVGFKYRYDEQIEQYAHPAVLILIADDGKITRYLYGVEYNNNDLRMALLETSKGKIGNTLDRIILFCYQYDPDAGGYVVFAGNVMRLGGGVTAVVLFLVVGTLLYREKKRKPKKVLAAAEK